MTTEMIGEEYILDSIYLGDDGVYDDMYIEKMGLCSLI